MVKRRTTRVTWTARAIAAICLLAIPLQSQAAGSEELPWEDARRFVEALEKIRAVYVEPVDDKTLFKLAIRGMASGLDPYSAYLDPAEHEQLRIDALGRYEGLGMEVAPLDGGYVIVAPLPGGPAQKAGLRAGDLLLMANGVVLDGVDVLALDELLNGPAGSQVKLTVQRDEEMPFEVTLEREIINIPSVSGERLEDGVLYVRLAHFNERSARDLSSLLDRIGASASGNGLILDLRDNSGGVVEGAVTIADAFLDEGTIVSTQGRSPAQTEVFSAAPGDISGGLPMLVLVNQGTASAAEILAAALRDNERALLLGARTFGKGAMQTLVPLEGGGALKITTAYYQAPSGRIIHGQGILPDIEVAEGEFTEQPLDDPLVQAAVKQLRERSR